MFQSSFTKLLVSMLVVFCVTFFVGCSKDDENNEPNYSSLPIVGTWEMVMANYEGPGYNHYIITTFSANGTGKEEQYVMYLGVKIDVDGSPISFKWTGNENTYTITSGESFLSGAKNIPYSVVESNGTKQLKILEYTFTKK